MTMSVLEKEIEISLKIADKTFAADSAITRFEAIQADFDLLVAQGFAKKRGNNSLSVIDAHLKRRISFNSK